LKQVSRVGRCYTRVRDQQRDFSHKLTTGWSREYDLIAFEGLARRAPGGAPPSGGPGGGMLRLMAQYKAERAGGRYVEVPSKGIDRSCSSCGKKLAGFPGSGSKMVRCEKGHVIDPDLNSARNVLNLAMATVGRGTPELTPVETGPPPSRKGRRTRSSKQEPPTAVLVAIDTVRKPAASVAGGCQRDTTHTGRERARAKPRHAVRERAAPKGLRGRRRRDGPA
jgi:transposase